MVCRQRKTEHEGQRWLHSHRHGRAGPSLPWRGWGGGALGVAVREMIAHGMHAVLRGGMVRKEQPMLRRLVASLAHGALPAMSPSGERVASPSSLFRHHRAAILTCGDHRPPKD